MGRKLTRGPTHWLSRTDGLGSSSRRGATEALQRPAHRLRAHLAPTWRIFSTSTRMPATTRRGRWNFDHRRAARTFVHLSGCSAPNVCSPLRLRCSTVLDPLRWRSLPTWVFHKSRAPAIPTRAGTPRQLRPKFQNFRLRARELPYYQQTTVVTLFRRTQGPHC